MEPMALWDLHLPKDDICVAKYDFDGLGPQIVERSSFIHGGLGWAAWAGNEVDKPFDFT